MHSGNFCRGRHLRSEEHTSELQSHLNLVCRLLLEKQTARDTPTPTSLPTRTSPSSASTHHRTQSEIHTLTRHRALFPLPAPDSAPFLFFLMMRRPPRSTLFPCASLFR